MYPTAGYIPDLAKNSEPGQISIEEIRYLRSLAKKVADIAANPKQELKRDLWYRHNRMENVRPMLLVFPEDSWIDVIKEDALEINDPFWRQWEWYLKHLIYRDEKLADDFVIEPDLYVSAVLSISDWGMKAKYTRLDPKGSYIWDPPLKNYGDIKKLRYPVLDIDENASQKRLEAVGEVFSDILPVHMHPGVRIDANLIGTVANLRGIEQVMLDIYDAPEWLHELMNFVTEGTLNLLRSLEASGYLCLNNRGHYTDSGGIGYTNELPQPDYDGKNVRLCDLWGFGVAQEFSEVSPQHHEEFVLDYQIRILKLFGLNAYGCCEPLTHKFEILYKIPRLRRVSVSPWCDIEKAAEKLKGKYIYSWKPNPAIIIGEFDPEAIRSYIRRTIETAKDCVLEIILKDTFTIDGEPQRLETFARIAREEIEKAYN